MIPSFIQERIKQPVLSSYISPNSTPVVFFGNIETAKAATLSLNPSHSEFYKKNRLLVDGDRRLETLISLGATSLETLTDEQVARVYERCLGYFTCEGARPYKPWFNKTESVIKSGLNMSYYDGTCCHLDIVQWATTPVWRFLPPEEVDAMLLTDLPFLKQLIGTSNIKLILLNGRYTWNSFKSLLHKEIDHASVEHVADLPKGLNIEHGDVNINGSPGCYIGWNKYLQQPIKQECVNAIVKQLKKVSQAAGF